MKPGTAGEEIGGERVDTRVALLSAPVLLTIYRYHGEDRHFGAYFPGFRSDPLFVPPGEESYSVRRVWLSEAEEDGYYYGFSNEGLWPLCHVAHTRPTFRAEDWAHYVRVNQRFADAV